MALSISLVWEVRPSGGSDSNGGGFLTGASGTDWTQQNAAQYSLTGLTTAGAAALIATTSAASDMVGNTIQITAGTNFTAGFYQILSVVVGVSITVDRNATTGVGAAGVGAIGGALATMSKVIAAAQTNNHIYLKGTYTATAIQNISASSDFNNPYTIEGYATARGDGTRAIWTTATNSISLIDPSSVSNIQFKNINFTNTAGTKGTGALGAALVPNNANAGSILINNCSFTGFNIAIVADWQNLSFAMNYLNLDNVEIKNSVSHGMVGTAGIYAFQCYFHGNGGDGFRRIKSGNVNAGTSPPIFAFCTFSANGINGFTDQDDQTTPTTPFVSSFGAAILNCNFVGNTGDGVNAPGNRSIPFIAANNIFYGNGGYGWNSPTANAIPNCIPHCNAYGSNTAGDRNNFPAGLGDFALSADPFTAKASDDFSLNSAAGGGVLCKGTGSPGTTPFGSGTTSVGALGASSGGGGGAITLQCADVLGIDG